MNISYKIISRFKRSPINLRTIFLLPAMLLFLSAFTTSIYANNTWTLTGDLNTPRNDHTSTQLNSNQVLVSGGKTGLIMLNGTEILNIDTGTWAYSSSMNQVRRQHVAALLDDGRVLASGGDVFVGYYNGWFPIYDCNQAAEIYDPATNSWSNTGFMNSGRVFNQATLLPDGKVLSFGTGLGCQISDTSAEIYDPDTGLWSSTDSLFLDHSSAGKTDLGDGKILLSGGLRWSTTFSYNIAEIYTPAGPSPISPPRGQYMHVADIDGTAITSSSSTSWTAKVTVTVADENNQPVYDLRVDMGGRLCYTDKNGQCSIERAASLDSLSISVAGIFMQSAYSNLPQIVYQPDANTDPDGDSDGTTLIIARDGSGSAPPPTTTSVHIVDLDDSSALTGNLWTPAVTVAMQDDLGGPKRYAWITGAWGNGLSGFFSCTTDINGICTGTYTSSIDTSTAPTGDVTISNVSYSTFPYDSSANSDPDGDSNGTRIILQAPPVTDPAPVSEPAPEPAPAPVVGTHVSDLEGSGEVKGSRRWRAKVYITVRDHNGNLVADADVNSSWSGGASGTDACTTDSSGQCRVKSDRVSNSNATITFTVTSISHSTLNYVSTANSDTDGDSNGTSITVDKP